MKVGNEGNRWDVAGEQVKWQDTEGLLMVSQGPGVVGESLMMLCFIELKPRFPFHFVPIPLRFN